MAAVIIWEHQLGAVLLLDAYSLILLRLVCRRADRLRLQLQLCPATTSPHYRAFM